MPLTTSSVITEPMTTQMALFHAPTKADAKPAKSFRSTETKASPRSTILQRLIPTTQRVTYQFDTYGPGSEATPPLHAVAIEEQNDRESAAECDALIEQAIREEWHKAGFNRFRHLRVEVRSGDVKLGGRLDCYYHKQMAHSLIRHVHGIRTIDNDIQVNS